MQYFIELSDEAKFTVKEILAYYAGVSISLKDRFEVELTKSIELLVKNPLHHQVRYRKVRIAFTEAFLYGIHYMVENEYIYILKHSTPKGFLNKKLVFSCTNPSDFHKLSHLS